MPLGRNSAVPLHVTVPPSNWWHAPLPCPMGRKGLLEALTHPQSAVLQEPLLAFLSQTASATPLFLCFRVKGW